MKASGTPSSGTKALFAGALDEIRGVLEAGAAAEVDKLCDELLKARRIACYGVGREGLMMRALCIAMRKLPASLVTTAAGVSAKLPVSAAPESLQPTQTTTPTTSCETTSAQVPHVARSRRVGYRAPPLVRAHTSG